MGTRKRLKDEVKETVDEAGRLIDEGVERAGRVIERGARKVGEGVRLEGTVLPPESQRRKLTAGEVFDETAIAIGKAGKEVVAVADRGVKKISEVVERNPDLKHAIDTGSRVMDRAVDKGVELARKGIEKTEELLDGRKKRK